MRACIMADNVAIKDAAGATVPIATDEIGASGPRSSG